MIDKPRALLIAGSLVFPTGFVGTLMILDHPGPPGPFGFAEYFGWWAVCVAVAWLGAKLLVARKYIAGIALPGIFALLLYLQVHPDTPNGIKQAVEYSLQMVGAVALAWILALAIRVGWTSRRTRSR